MSRLVLIGSLCLMSVGCATAGSLRSEPLSAGVAQSFPAPVELVVEGARQAMIDAGLTIDEAYSRDGGAFVVQGSKGASAGSWGELVRVVVAPVADATRVNVVTKRRMATNITAKGDYSRAIFGGIELFLASASPQAPLPRTQEPQTTGKWKSPPPLPSEVIRLTQGDLNPSGGSTVFERVAPAVVALRGDAGLGSAFIITREGLALTNDHVVDGQSWLVARMADGREYAVRVLRRDTEGDVALVEIDCASDCPTVVLGDDAALQPTDDVLVIGTPLFEELSQSVSRGIVSGTRRAGGRFLIQVDAPINPGNSGGPIVETKTGTVVAVATSKMVGESVEGIGFGIAITDALRIMGIRLDLE